MSNGYCSNAHTLFVDIQQIDDGNDEDSMSRNGATDGWDDESIETSLFPKPRGRWRTLSLAEQIAEQVGESILRDEYRPGDAVTEQSLSEQFAVSRGPVRDALRILEKEGLVEIIPRRGAQVTQLTTREVSDIFDIRAILLGHVARLAARRGDPECLRFLKEGCAILEQNLKKTNDLDVHFRVSARMNFVLASRSGNEKLCEIIFQLARQIARYTRLGLSTPERRSDSVKTWHELVILIENGMEDEAEILERQRVKQAQALAVKILSSGEQQYGTAVGKRGKT